MARSAVQTVEKQVNEESVAQALAKSVLDGDIVNFRLIFASFSPARVSSSERFETEKYAYLLPDDEMLNDTAFLRLVDKVKQSGTWDHIQRELNAKRPAQLPSSLLLPLADNAVRHGKYTSAGQAYELLRVRRRMQSMFLDEGDKAIDSGDMPRAVRACRIGLGLCYDYAAFPEPLPLTPNYQTDALKLHGVYPTRPEDCPAWLDADMHSRVALEFLLIDTDVAARITARPFEVRLQFLQELVRQLDPNWDEFVERYHEAINQTQALSDYLKRHGLGTGRGAATLEDEVEGQQFDDPSGITATLLGREIEDGTWWQYLKELAYQHPAAVLFVGRQVVGDHEILIPPLRTKDSLATTFGLMQIDAED